MRQNLRIARLNSSLGEFERRIAKRDPVSRIPSSRHPVPSFMFPRKSGPPVGTPHLKQVKTGVSTETGTESRRLKAVQAVP